MKKGIIVAITVAICAMLAVTYAFAAPGKAEKKDVKKEVTTTEKQKETTTAEKPKTETKESEELNIEETEISTEEESDIENAEEVSDDQEESDDSEPEDEEDLDNEEIDDEEMDRCDHVWSEKSVAYDSEEGYVWVQNCEKCSLVKQTPATEEDYDAAQQEESEEN